MNNTGVQKYSGKTKKGFNRNPDNGTNNVVKPDQIHQGTSTSITGQQFATVKQQPDAITVMELNFSLTADATAGNETAVIPIVPQYSTDAFPAGITFASTQFTAANFIKYFSTISCIFGRVQVSTDNNLNWAKSIRSTPWFPNGNQPAENKTWDRYKNLQYLDQTTRIIPDSGWVTGNLFMQTALIGMRVSSVLTFIISVVSIGLPKDYVPAQSL